VTTATDTDTDVSVLTDYEFPLACEHSIHGVAGSEWWHSGDAYYWARCWHVCDGPPVIYMLCKPSGDWFHAQRDKRWRCLRCGHTDMGSRMVELLSPINP
jgi:hypothetical protein